LQLKNMEAAAQEVCSLLNAMAELDGIKGSSDK
jgi:hypothetical protein